MKLMTKKLAAKLPKLYETEQTPLLEKLVIVKFFHPIADWSWYAVEYDGDDTCFGLVVGQSTEFGYFTLGELSQRMSIYNCPAERDAMFRPTKVKDLLVYGIERVAA